MLGRRKGFNARAGAAALLLAAGTALLVAPLVLAQDEAEPEPASETAGPVLHIALDSIIHPVAAQFVTESLAEAEKRDASLFVMELSTPGGLLTSTREIFSAMLDSDVPTAVYVSPPGSQAASAGFFILMGADIAAMAPGTNTGAAHPVGGQGEEIEGTLGEKVEQDAAATIRSLAARNGRDEELAEMAVVESRSFTAEEALEGGLIDFIVEDVDELIAAADGREVGPQDGKEPIRTAGARIERLEMTGFQRLLSALAHPNIAYILMSLGFLGLYFEFQSPGAILPGVIGGICIILAFFGLSVLPVNYAGIALILLAMIFFIAEVKVTSYGLLTVGGVVALVLGSLMLFKSADPAIRVGFDVIAAAVVFTVLVVGLMMRMVLRAHKSQVTTGVEGLVNKRGTARSELAPAGKVNVHGEIWNATSDAPGTPIAAGTEIRVVGVDGMTLRVRPLADAAATDDRDERSREVAL